MAQAIAPEGWTTTQADGGVEADRDKPAAASTMSWSRALAEYNGRKKGDGAYKQNTEAEVFQCLRKMFFEMDEEKRRQEPSFAVVPRFFYKKNAVSDLQQRVRKEARTRFLEKKHESLLDEEELERLWELMMEYQTPPRDGKGERLDYDAFCIILNEMPPKARSFCTPSTFLKFPRDSFERISARALFHYIVRKVGLTQLRISLTCYDEVGAGYLREQDLENYIFEQIPSLPQLAGLELDFYPYYVFSAVRKFVFFLDPLRKGKISIKDIVSSPILREFNELRLTQSDEGDPEHDWFTSRAALKIYAMYLNLDVDHNGMLSQEEFSRYGQATLTPVFVDRLFQEYRMYKSETGRMEMDYKTFLDFVLAMQNKESVQGLQYFWRILDIEKTGQLTLFTLNYFFKAVVDKMVACGHDPVRVEDVTNEIFDMIRPANPAYITFDDLVRSGVGHTVVSILTDVNGFWAYDNRELLIAS